MSKKLLSIILILIAIPLSAFASSAPEIDMGSASAAVALVVFGGLSLYERLKK